MNERVRDWAPDLAVGVLVLIFGAIDLWGRVVPYGTAPASALFVVVGFALACGLSRKAPGVALLLIWITCGMQLVTGTSVLTVQLAVAIVAFGCARWGSAVTVVLSGLSIPAAAGVGYALVTQASWHTLYELAVFQELLGSPYRFSDTLAVGATILGLLMLAVPWLLGLAFRASARARRSEVRTEQAEADAAAAHRETEQAREIARLQEQQSQLARDVHDVVGHSLAVILAQAESGQYLGDDPETLKKTMATIASSARSSLQDVRQVLSGTQTSTASNRAFEELIEGVRAGGHEVRTSEVGIARPLPPELEVAAHRVLQEMLTNAIKHGRRDRPVFVERHWPEGSWDRDLRIEVRNVIDPGAGAGTGDISDETQPIAAVPSPGQGLEGMRRRLEAVGGRLDVRRRATDGEPTFTATAWLPVSGR